MYTSEYDWYNKDITFETNIPLACFTLGYLIKSNNSVLLTSKYTVLLNCYIVLVLYISINLNVQSMIGNVHYCQHINLCYVHNIHKNVR